MTTKRVTTTDVINEIIDNEFVLTKIRKTYENLVLQKVEYYNVADQLHRINEPAVVEYSGNEQVSRVIWYLNGKKHRDRDLPAEIAYNCNGDIIYQAWYINGIPSRIKVGAPNVIKKLCDGYELREYYFANSINLASQLWYKDDKLNSYSDSPAEIGYNISGRIVHKKWYKDDKLHRPIENGPAVMLINIDGSIKVKYYLDGQLQKFPDIDDLIEKIKKFSKEDIEKCLEILEIMKK